MRESFLKKKPIESPKESTKNPKKSAQRIRLIKSKPERIPPPKNVKRMPGRIPPVSNQSRRRTVENPGETWKMPQIKRNDYPIERHSSPSSDRFGSRPSELAQWPISGSARPSGTPPRQPPQEPWRAEGNAHISDGILTTHSLPHSLPLSLPPIGHISRFLIKTPSCIKSESNRNHQHNKQEEERIKSVGRCERDRKSL